jgi:hypothetical protein
MLLNVSEMIYSFSFTTKRVIRILSILLLLLLIANIAANYFKWVKGYETALGIIPLFDFDGEFNIPSLFSFGLITFNALLLSLISKHTAVPRKERKYWRTLSYIFFFLALDEMVSIHERVGLVLHSKMPNVFVLSDSRFWILPMSFLLLCFLLYFFRFFFGLLAKTKLKFLIAGLLYVTGAIGVEILGDIYMWYHDKPDFFYGLLASLEELLEMIGMILFLEALLTYLQELSESRHFSLDFSVGKNKAE